MPINETTPTNSSARTFSFREAGVLDPNNPDHADMIERVAIIRHRMQAQQQGLAPTPKALK